jgi:hypothetical protein
MNYYYVFYLAIIIISNSLSVFCQKQGRELITKQVTLIPNYQQVFNHAELPVVEDELSVTLKINIINLGYNLRYFHPIFYKGITYDY